MKHKHKAKFYSRLNSGTVYETCECGAVQIDSMGWHACALCVLGWPS